MTTDANAAPTPWLCELFQLAPRVIRLTDALLRELSPPVSYRQFRLLERIADGQTTLTQIGRMATLTLPSISEALDVLARKELVERRLDGDDRRSSQLALTPLGRIILDEGNKVLGELSDELLEGVPASDRQRLREVLGLIDERIGESHQHRR